MSLSKDKIGLNYVIDTSLLLHDPRVIDGYLGFSCHHQVKMINLLIPIYVLEELDLHKEEMNERGQKARTITRKLEQLSKTNSLNIGISTARGPYLKVVETESPLPERIRQLPHLIYDWLILQCAQENDATLLTKDSNLKVRANGLGVPTLDWYDYAEQSISVETEQKINGTSKDEQLASIQAIWHKVWGLEPRNEEQAIVLGALLDPTLSLVTITGKAGTGKTLLALAAGLHQVTESNLYERVLVSRAIFPLGRDIGYLPGTLEEKMEPWLQPIYDNLDFLLSHRDRRQSHRQRSRADELVDMGLIEVNPIAYIRGRSIPKQYLIIDEAQNLTPHEVKTILTRAGDGAKIVLIGDPYQVDHPYLDQENNGLKHVVRKFIAQDCAVHLRLTKGERSPLAELAADLL